MTDENKYKAGDEIVRYSRIWKIFKIKKQKGADGKEQEAIYYKPVFPINTNGALSLCIPASNLKESGIRRPISKKKVRFLLKTLNEKLETKKPVNLIKIRKKLEQDVFDTTFKILRRLWWNKKNNVDSFTPSKENIFKLAIKKLSEEIAFVNDISLAKARKKIKNALEKSKSAKWTAA